MQRVRYTGKPVDLPTALAVRRDGLAITFSRKLDPELANDPESFAVSMWNYRYASTYGSKEWKVSAPDEEGRESVQVTAATLQADGRTVVLTLEKLQPVMQMAIDYDVEAEDGAEVYGKIFNTIHRVPE